MTYLVNKHYPKICHQKKAVVSDEGVWSETEEFGFHTNVKTKPLIIDHLQNALRSLLLVLHDEKTLKELETYVVKNVNKEGHAELGADEGQRDDCVMALAVANYYLEQLPSHMPQLGSARTSMSKSITGY